MSNHIHNIAIVGAGGRSGTHIVSALLSHLRNNNNTSPNAIQLTALTRPGSTNTLPPGLHKIKQIDYTSHSSLVSALTGQEVLIITLNQASAPDAQKRLVDAAAEAGVTWIIPNEWGYDYGNEVLARETGLGARWGGMRAYIDEVSERVCGGRMKWIGVACGFWYEFSLAGSPARYGFDIPARTLTLFDAGETKIHTSTLEQVGRGVAALLSLPVHAPPTQNTTNGNKPGYLEAYANTSISIASFHLSQRDMLDSILRVTHDSVDDWNLTQESSAERYARAAKKWEAEKKNPVDWITMMYTRVFFPDGSGDLGQESLMNDVLGLPVEGLDEATSRAVEIARTG